MKKKMVGYILLIIILLGAFLIFSVLKVRITPSPVMPKPDTAGTDEQKRLCEHVRHLSVRIGSRSVFEYDRIEATRQYILSVLEGFGYTPELQDYVYHDRVYSNIIVSSRGEKYPDETVIVGAHYDTVYGTPGADDNGSAVAVLLELCRAVKDFSPARTLKLIFFTLEEPPLFRTDSMGSAVYAARAQSLNENIQAMICLEMVGYYSDRKGGQSFPLPLMSLMYSTTPDFIAVVGNLRSRRLVARVKQFMEAASRIPVETLSTVSFVPGVDFSDHRSFWKAGYRAVMVTDTAFYRNPNYHSARDTIDTLDFTKMAEVLKGLINAAKGLAGTR